MARITINETILNDIADAIRNKLNVENQYTPQNMAAVINSIESPNLMTANILANGEYTPSGDKNGFSKVTVNVPNAFTQSDEGKVVSNGILVSQTSVTKTANGTYDTTQNNEVTVNVLPNLQEKTANQNGDVLPDSGYDGLSKVTVNVSGGGGSGGILTPDYYGLSYGYIGGGTNGVWMYTQKKTYSASFYEISAGDQLCIFTTDEAGFLNIIFFNNRSLNDFLPGINNPGSGLIFQDGVMINYVTSNDAVKKRYFYTPSSNGVLGVETSSNTKLIPAYCIKLS